MRRADRLFQIIQILRRSTRPVTAAMLAKELEVSRRTVYRDMGDLIGQRVPIEGEAGLGYLLTDDYDMPPLMLTPDELEAVVLGAQWVASHGDETLARAAADVVSKIATAVPAALRSYIVSPSVGVKATDGGPKDAVDATRLRAAIHNGRKLRLRYRSESGEETERTVHPVILGYAETSRLLIAWCEMRESFRHFRTERMLEVEVLETSTDLRQSELRRRWELWREQQVRSLPSAARQVAILEEGRRHADRR